MFVRDSLVLLLLSAQWGRNPPSWSPLRGLVKWASTGKSRYLCVSVSSRYGSTIGLTAVVVLFLVSAGAASSSILVSWFSAPVWIWNNIDKQPKNATPTANENRRTTRPMTNVILLPQAEISRSLLFFLQISGSCVVVGARPAVWTADRSRIPTEQYQRLGVWSLGLASGKVLVI